MSAKGKKREEWRDLPSSLRLSNYKVSDHGRVYNTLTLRYLKGSRIITLSTDDNKLITFNIPELMKSSLSLDEEISKRDISGRHIDGERWNELPRYLRLTEYMASTEGHLVHKESNSIVPTWLNREGYTMVKLINDDGVKMNHRVDALILESFVPRPES